jgi:hypothetical protein
MISHRWFARLRVCIVGLLLGCGSVTDVNHPAAAVVVQKSLALVRGAQQQLQVSVRSADGAEIAGATVHYSSTAFKIANVNTAGVVSALGVGVASILVTSGNITAVVTVTVSDPDALVPANVQLATSTLTLWPGDSATVSAMVSNRWNEPLPSSGLTWTSSMPGVAVVSSTGVVHGLATGSATITATAGVVSRTVAVLVHEYGTLVLLGTNRLVPGAESPMSLVKFDSASLQTRTVAGTWSSSDPTVVSVSADGVATGLRSGEATVTGTTGGVPMLTKIVVAPLPGVIAYRVQAGQVAFLPLDGSSPTRTAIDVDATGTVALSRDGSQLGYDCGADVCVRDLLTGIRRLFLGKASDPSWTCDGSRIAVRTDLTAVNIVPVASGQTLAVRTSHYMLRPRISADGAWLVYQCDINHPYDELTDLCIQSTQPGADGPLYFSDASDVALSPRGDSLAFVAKATLCVATLHTPGCASDPRRSCILDVTEPSWSPDGSYLVVVRAGGLWITNPAGSTCMRLTGAGQTVSAPSWGTGKVPAG